MSPFLKRRLKRIAEALGIRARLVLPVRRDMASFCRHLRDIGYSPATIIDVGVADGTLDLYEPFPDAELLLVEPVLEFEPAIRQILRRWRGTWAAVAAGAVEHEAYMAAPGETAADLHNSRIVDVGPRRVAVRRVDQLAAGLSGPFLLKADVEGTEADVVDGAAGILEHTDVIILEIRFMDMVGGSPVAHEVIARMAALGYVIYDIFNLYARPLDGALNICDMAFVRANSAILRDRRWASEEQCGEHDRSLTTKIRNALAA